MLSTFNLKGKKVFITGITGFKGSWLALMCHALGAEVSGVGLKETNKDHIFNQAKIENFAKVYISNLLNIDKSKEAYCELIESDYVFHLAAQAIVSEGYNNPIKTFKANSELTLILHELLTCSEKKMSIINVTTDKVYKPKGVPHVETDELCGEDPYSLSKSFADMISTMYVETYYKDMDVPLIVSSVRAGNVIGGGDFGENRIMTDIVKAIFKEEPLRIRNRASIRPYQYVLDCLFAYLLIAIKQYENPDVSGKYNVGPNMSSVVCTEDLVNSCQRKYALDVHFNGESIGKENPILLLDNKKIKEILHWEQLYDKIDDITEVTLNWFNAFYNNENMEEYSKKEVENFLKMKEREML